MSTTTRDRETVRRTAGARRRRWGSGPVTIVLVAAALSLMLLDLRSGPTDLLRSLGQAVGGPLQEGAGAVLGPVRAGEFRRADLESLQQEVDRLRDENRRTAVRADLLAEKLQELDGAAEARRDADRMARGAVTARVVAAAPGPASAAVTLDVGSGDGIVVDAPVLVSGGLIGKVADVGPATSTVRLVTDPGSDVAGRIGEHAVLVRGEGGDSARLDHLDPLAPVEVGQRIVTLGSADGWPYPAGLPLGTVREVEGSLGDLDRTVTLEPATRAGTVDHVIVLTPPDGVAP